MKRIIVLLVSALFVFPAYGSDKERKAYSLNGVVLTPEGAMVPELTVVLRPRTDSPRLIPRLHFKGGIFEVQDLTPGQYRVEITAPRYTGVLLNLELSGPTAPAAYRIVVMQPVRTDIPALASSYGFSPERPGPSIPPDAEAAYIRGVELHRNGRLEQAMMAYGEALQIFPDYVKALRDIGAVYIVLNRQDSAMTFLRRAFRLDPDDIVVRINIATALVNMGKYADGIPIFKEILHEYQAASEVRYMLAKAYFAEGDELSEEAVRQALAEAPERPDAWVLLFNLAVAQSNDSTAREALTRLKGLLNDDGFSQFIERQVRFDLAGGQ